MREAIAVCRICAGSCPLIYTFDDDGKVAKVAGDHSNPRTSGYACIKGLSLHEAHESPERILRPLRRREDGTFEEVRLKDALDEIAARVSAIIEKDGPDAVAGFRGTMGAGSIATVEMLAAYLSAIGSRSLFTTMTIDQSAKWVSMGRLGMWTAGRQSWESTDRLMLIGSNPMVSLFAFGIPLQNPVKTMKEARARGMKLIVIDPRRSETARFADLFVQPIPGEDVTLMAGVIRTVLENGWHDAEFCAAHVDGLEELRKAVEPYTDDYVVARAGVKPGDVMAIASLYAEPVDGRARRGPAITGTGPNMAPHSNLAEHLVEVLNVICGRFARAGEKVVNPGVMLTRPTPRASVVPPMRSWEKGWKDTNGFGMILGQRMSATLPDAILSNGEDKVRALFVVGANPVNAIPETLKTYDAFERLDLLVAVEPFMNETSRRADFILPPVLMLERADISHPIYEAASPAPPYAMWQEPIMPRPEGSELVEDWRVFWEIAARQGLELTALGVTFDTSQAVTTDEIHERMITNPRIPLDELKRAGPGKAFDVPEQFIEEGPGGAKFEVAPADVCAELAEVRAMQPGKDRFRLTCRRMREVSNTMYHTLPTIRRRVKDNPAFLNPDDLAELGVAEGAKIRISTEHGEITVTARSDAALRRGVVSITHGWGGEGVGVNVNLLTALDDTRDPINAMSVMTAFSVEVEAV
ncbi:MAG: molybdopterin-dependent oxidoreductase [Novosphingobium sp.]|nr:molybdopterin-dependent oxidoreductase [Novosphingobium sp.]